METNEGQNTDFTPMVSLSTIHTMTETHRTQKWVIDYLSN